MVWPTIAVFTPATLLHAKFVAFNPTSKVKWIDPTTNFTNAILPTRQQHVAPPFSNVPNVIGKVSFPT